MPSSEEVRGFYPEEYYGEPGTKFQPRVERLVRVVGERHISFLTRLLDPGARVLDLFAGTGAVGIEALSRGAAEVVFIDLSPAALRTVRKNLERTQLAERAVLENRISSTVPSK